ncbi:MAG TPA: pyridoxal phosphate-dependent aminotransferase [Polyangia bacterium]|nr:pyridoxal phosphate-dependent aminotransferase [Polyangia bacterium]
MDGTSRRYSRRLSWSVPPSPLSLLVEEEIARGNVLLDLTSSNPTRAGLPYSSTLLSALTHPEGLIYRPDPSGLPVARAAIARYYAERGHAVDPEHLVLTASTSEAYAWVFKLLCDPGDTVLVPQPSYPLFDYLAALECVSLRPYHLGFDGHWYLDEAELDRVAEGAKAALLVHPNNPTGSFLSRAEWEALVTRAGARGFALVVDEVFSDFVLTPGGDRLDSTVSEARVLTFTLSGLSKVVGLPQLKLGWIHVGGPAAEVREALARLELIADTYLSVSTPVALAAPSLLAEWRQLAEPLVRRTAGNLALIAAAVAGSPVSLLPVAGGWYAMLRLPRTRSDEEWAMTLVRRDGVLVQPGYFYDVPIEACLVISLLTPPEILKEGLDRLRRRVETDAGA